jgi:hypothetical protein
MRAGTLILLAVVVALGFYIRFFERKKDPTDRKREIARRVLRINPARIDVVRVARPELQFAAERRDGEWRLTSPVAARANAGVLDRLIDTVEMLERSDVIRGREWRKKGMTLADFGLDAPRARIVLAGGGREWTLLIGRDTPVGGNLYLKEANDSSVFIAPTNLLADLPVALDELRDRRVFLGFPGDVARIDLRRREGLLNLTRTDVGSWRMQQPWSGRASGAGVQDLLDQLFAARIAEFVAESFDAAPLYGLDEPAAQAAVTGDRRYGEQVLLIGKPVARDTNLVYATRGGEGTVFAVPRALLDALQTRAETLRDRRLITAPAYDIAHIRIEEDERVIRLARDDAGVWEIREPILQKADEQRIQDALAVWTGLRIESFADQVDTNLAAWGFAPPARVVAFSRRAPTSDGAAARTAAEDDATIAVSTLPPSNGLILVRVANEGLAAWIRADAADALPLSTLHYRHPEVLSFDIGAVRSLTVAQEGREQSVQRESATNEFRAATPGQTVDADQIRAALETLSNLRAAQFVASAQAAAEYGLDTPYASITVGLQGGLAPVRTLLIGANTDAGVHAMLRGGDVVFLLPHATRDKLLRPLYKSARTTKESPVASTPAANPPIEQPAGPGP